MRIYLEKVKDYQFDAYVLVEDLTDKQLEYLKPQGDTVSVDGDFHVNILPGEYEVIVTDVSLWTDSGAILNLIPEEYDSASLSYDIEQQSDPEVWFEDYRNRY